MIGNPIIKKEVFENYLDKDSLSFTKAIPLSNMNDFIDELFYSKTFRGIFCGYPLLRYNDTYLMVWVGCSFCRRNDLSHTREYCGSYGAPLSWQNKVEVKNNLVKNVLDISSRMEENLLYY